MEKKILEHTELDVLDKLVDAWNRFITLPPYHLTDTGEFAQAIHVCQNIVMARLAVRIHPDLFLDRINDNTGRTNSSENGTN